MRSFGPLTGIEVLRTRIDGSVVVIECSFSINLTALTIEQVLGKRQKVVRDMVEQLRRGAQRDVETNPAWVRLRDADGRCPAVDRFFEDMLAPLAEHEVTHYNENGPLGDAIQEAVALADGISRWPEGLKALAARPRAWLQQRLGTEAEALLHELDGGVEEGAAAASQFVAAGAASALVTAPFGAGPSPFPFGAAPAPASQAPNAFGAAPKNPFVAPAVPAAGPSALQRREVSAAVASLEPHSLIGLEPRRLPLAVVPQATTTAAAAATTTTTTTTSSSRVAARTKARPKATKAMTTTTTMTTMTTLAGMLPALVGVLLALAVVPQALAGVLAALAGAPAALAGMLPALAAPVCSAGPLPLPIPLLLPQCRVMRPTGSAASRGTPPLRRCP